MELLSYFLDNLWLGKPVWMWLTFVGIVIVLLALDLGVLHRTHRAIGIRESLVLSAGYIALALLYGVWVWWELGAEPGLAYFTGFAIEKALAIDNVFVIAMIFSFFAVPPRTTRDGQEVGAVRAVLGSMLSLLEDGATHQQVAGRGVVRQPVAGAFLFLFALAG